MRLLHLFCVVLFVIGVSAQRRPTKIESTSAEAPTQRSVISRGRAKFTSSPEFAEIADVPEPTQNRKSKPAPRRRLDYERHLEPRQRSQEVTQRPKSPSSYEVQEVVDDIPRENIKRPILRPRPDQISSRVLPSTTTVKVEASSTVSTTKAADVSTEEQKVVSEETTAAEQPQEISTADAEASLASTIKLFTPESSEKSVQDDIPKLKKPSEPAPVSEVLKEEPRRTFPRAPLKSRANIRIEEPSTARTIQRTRPTRRVETTSQETVAKSDVPKTRSNFRRRPSASAETIQHEVSRRGPSVFSSEGEHPTRSRTGRKILEHQKFSRRIDTSAEIEVRDTSRFRRTGIEAASSRRRETVVASENQGLHDSKEINKLVSRRAPSSKLLNRGRTIDVTSSEIPPEKSVRRNSRLRQMPHFDETKLEVLPLFESDTKTEKSTAVDSVPEISKIVPESTTPLTTPKATTEATSVHTTSPQSKATSEPTTPKSRAGSRRIPSRPPIREIKNNKVDSEPHGRGFRRQQASTTTTAAPARTHVRENHRGHRAKEVKSTQEPSSSVPTRTRGRVAPETSTAEPRRKLQRVLPKKIEPTVPETRLQNLAPRRGAPGRRPSPTSSTTTTTTTVKPKVEVKSTTAKPKIEVKSTTAKPKVEVKSTTAQPEAKVFSSRGSARGNSRFNKMEDELASEEAGETNVSKSVKSLDEAVTQAPKRSRNTKRGTTKDHSELTSSEEQIGESDNYPEPFKALIQAKLKNKETRSRTAEDGSASTERHLPSPASPRSTVQLPTSTSASALVRDHRKDEDNELNVLNSPATPKPISRRPFQRQSKPETNDHQNKIESSPKQKPTTPSPPSISTSKEVLTSISSKTTRQRFHARFKADPKNVVNKTVTPSGVNSVDRYRLNNRPKPRNLAPPKAATGIYSSKKSARSTTVAPKVESSTTYKRGYTARGNAVLDHIVATSEAPHIASSPIKPKSRFSAKYRSDLLRATGFKASPAPAYLPTVPTVTPYVSDVGNDDYYEYQWSFNRV